MEKWLNKCHFGDCLTITQQMIDDDVRVNCIITSPPYFALRDYGVTGQIGLENNVDDYINNIVSVFDLCRQLLIDDGVLLVNLGDSYSGSGKGRNKDGQWNDKTQGSIQETNKGSVLGRLSRATEALPPKNLYGVPWRVAFALQATGWILRQDIIWSKPNPMPESVKDRCTKSHEYLFLLSKNTKYYFDIDAIKEDALTHEAYPKKQHVPSGWDTGNGSHDKLTGRYASGKCHAAPELLNKTKSNAIYKNTETRNKRSVWTIPTQAYSGAHFATFPEALVEPCILAASRVGDIVYDPFFGSGTVGQVAQNLGRRWIGCEINPEYATLQRERTAQMAINWI
ncbi:MAG: site-specific DNA-methyltransferase [Burkholderiales bacterium]|jgi:site-specific DNA-methyltransferase (cytosine-N4-specific)|nr:site-specific DNA-methyltransferase [Burkholderiales bacterium]